MNRYSVKRGNKDMPWSDKVIHKGDGYQVKATGDGTVYVKYREPRVPGVAEVWRVSADLATTNYFLKKAVLEMAGDRVGV